MASRLERHSLLPLPAWGVVPGARFREVYYWDSLWAVRGLLSSGMRATAQARCPPSARLDQHDKARYPAVWMGTLQPGTHCGYVWIPLESALGGWTLLQVDRQAERTLAC